MGITAFLVFTGACLEEDANLPGESFAEDHDKTRAAEAAAEGQASAKASWGQAKRCGDGQLDKFEECDDGGTLPGDGCSEVCTIEGCRWDFDELSFPLDVRLGEAAIGEITYDGNCDLIVSGGEELPYSDAIYRVDKDDGSVSVVVAAADLPPDTFSISGMTQRASDDRVYFFAEQHDEAPNYLYAIDDQDQLHTVTEVNLHISSLSVAPDGFGDFGDQLIAVSYAPRGLYAIDVENLVITPLAETTDLLSVATFGNDGTLYVAEFTDDQISTVTPDGVFTPFVTGLNAPDGLAISPDGAQLFVAYLQDGGRIDRISIADQTLTPGVLFELSTGLAATGMVVDATNRVLYEITSDDFTALHMFDGS